MINRTNPFSGESIELNEEEDRLYCIIKNSEINEQYDEMQKLQQQAPPTPLPKAPEKLTINTDKLPLTRVTEWP